MLEWLPRDPLNGIVISITFFCSLIIGRYISQRSGGKMLDARIKFLVTILLIISVTIMKHSYFPIIISALCLLIAAKQKILRDYSGKLIFPVVFAIFIVVTQFIFSANILFLLFSRVLASSSIMILFVMTTSRKDILESMSWFRVPQTIIDISFFMERYILTFSKEGKTLKAAAESRCGFRKQMSFLHRIKNLSSICGILIIRAFDRSDEIYRAMVSRAWRLKIRHSRRPLSISDIVVGSIISSGIIGLSFIDRLI